MEFFMHFFDDIAVKLCLVMVYALMAISLLLFARGQAQSHELGWDNMLSIWAVALILLCFLGLLLLAIQNGVFSSVVWLAVGIALGFVLLNRASCNQSDGEFS